MKHIENMIASAKLHLGAIKFDRNELSGAFGDIGTDFPLIGTILAYLVKKRITGLAK